MSRLTEHLEGRAHELGAELERKPADGIYVVGYAARSPLGKDADSMFDEMLNGASGIKSIPVVNPLSRIAGPIEFEPKDFFNRKELRGASHVTALSSAMARDAALMAGLIGEDGKTLQSDLNRKRVAAWIAGGIGSAPQIIKIFKKMYEGTEEIADEEKRDAKMLHNLGSSDLLFAGMEAFPQGIVGHPARRLGFSGWSGGTAEACATGLSNLVEAARLIEGGYADIVFAGGFEDVLSDPDKLNLPGVGLAAFSPLRALSSRNDAPEKASRPFDRDRNGFVFSAGGGIVVLERKDHVLERIKKGSQVEILCEVTGFSKSIDGYHETQLDVKNVARTTIEALYNKFTHKMEGVGAFFAHATSTPVGDRMEAEVLEEVFGKFLQDIPIAAIKSNIGHTMGGAGILNAIVALISLRRNIIPHIINLDNPRLNVEDLSADDDPRVNKMQFVRGKPLEKELESTGAGAYGFDGMNAAMRFKKYHTTD